MSNRSFARLVIARILSELKIRTARGWSFFRLVWRLRIRNSRKLPVLPRIAYAVLVHERPQYLADSLASLFESDLGGYEIDIYLIDDGSKSPEVAEIIEKFSDKVFKVLFLDKTVSGTAGEVINRALKVMQSTKSYDLYGWSDPDALYSQYWLKNTLEIAIIARNSNQNRRLGPFTSFNSNDAGHLMTKNHWLYQSKTSIVVKEQAGMLNLFCTPEDLRVMGKFPESLSDEITVCRRMRRRGLYFFSTKISFIEHIGASSNFDAFRVDKYQNITGLNLAVDKWPKSLEKYNTVGYYRDIRKTETWGSNHPISNMPLEVAIPCAEKDFQNLKFVIEGVNKNLKHPVDRISVIGSDQVGDLVGASGLNVNFIHELEILEKPMKKLFIDGHDRTNWMYQQFLKLEYVSKSKFKKVLILDADTILTTPQIFEIEGKDLVLCTEDWYEPYHRFNHLANIQVEHKLSAVCHNALMDVNVCQKLLSYLASKGSNSWMDFVLETMKSSPDTSFSEFQIYKDFLFLNYVNNYVIEFASNLSEPWKYSDLVQSNFDSKCGSHRSVSFHSWQEKKLTINR